MSSPFQVRKAEEKLRLIIGRIGSIRARINSLAWQRAAFGGLGWTIAAAALATLAAFYLRPLPFLAVAVIAGLAGVLGLIRNTRAAWRMRVDSHAAAQVADRRAELKGRLETIVEIGLEMGPRRKVVKLGHTHERPALWSYLIEDTLSRQDEFEPARIEGRRISRSIYGFLGALALAAVIFPLAVRQHAKAAAAPGDPTDMTLSLNDLNLRPADPGSDDGVAVRADPQTMRRLEQKMASDAAAAEGASSSSLGRLVDQAKDLAGKLQSKLTGREESHQRIDLKLTDSRDELDAQANAKRLNLDAPREQQDTAGQWQQDQSPNDDISPRADSGSLPGSNQQRAAAPQADADNGSDEQRQTSNDNSSGKPSEEASNDQGAGGGASHGVGNDPDTLFGPASDPKLGSQGFEISIDARPLEHGSKGPGHAYLPPKVRTPLNSRQHPDEPIARASVPEEDRAAIKRVFER